MPETTIALNVVDHGGHGGDFYRLKYLNLGKIKKKVNRIDG